MKKYLSIFRNIKFNIGLFALLAIFSMIGTLIPQIPENPGKVEEFIARSPKLGPLFQKLELFNIYHSWWFIGLLGLLAFDVIVCKLIFGKFPGSSTFKKEEQTANALFAQKFRASWNVSEEPDGYAKKMIEQLKKEGYVSKMFPLPTENQWMILACRHRVQRFGSWVSHISILIILLANLTGALYGFREVLNLPQGLSSPMQNRPWLVTCDQFMVDWYPGTETPKTFTSSLRLFEHGRMVREQKILVNEPLEYKKVRIYQASYGPYLKEARIGFYVRKNPKRSQALTVKLDEDTAVPGTPYSLRILQFVPDFSLDKNKEVVSRSVHPQNPAVQILISENGKPIKAPWIFEKFPAVQMPPIQSEDEFVLLLAEYVPAYYTGLQITYDPGADFFWSGCAILVAGLMILFYFHHRKLWLLVEKNSAGNGTIIQMGGYSSRGKSFEEEFEGLAGALR